ncbi:hypothetical protein BH24BAC1_BH24BAC1_00440 [soil metagenome]
MADYTSCLLSFIFTHCLIFPFSPSRISPSPLLYREIGLDFLVKLRVDDFDLLQVCHLPIRPVLPPLINNGPGKSRGDIRVSPQIIHGGSVERNTVWPKARLHEAIFAKAVDHLWRQPVHFLQLLYPVKAP